MKKILTLFIIVSAFAFKASAQTYEVPKNYVFKAKTDYEPYEPQVISTINWLQATSWDDEKQKQKEANAFLVVWLTGSPSVSIDVSAALIKLTEKNPDLLITFMGGYTKYALQNKTDFDKKKANLEGVKALLDKYKMEKSHKKNKDVEELIKLNQDGTLSNWTDKNF
jgi:flagellar motility protein MotE (MotC chaperone)